MSKSEIFLDSDGRRSWGGKNVAVMPYVWISCFSLLFPSNGIFWAMFISSVSKYKTGRYVAGERRQDGRERNGEELEEAEKAYVEKGVTWGKTGLKYTYTKFLDVKYSYENTLNVTIKWRDIPRSFRGKYNYTNRPQQFSSLSLPLTATSQFIILCWITFVLYTASPITLHSYSPIHAHWPGRLTATNLHYHCHI